jgi:hypothetical protein
MRALFECRLEHIGHYDRVKVECACGRTVPLSVEAFAGLSSNTRIIDLKRRLKCDSCGERGRVMVSLVWADYAARHRYAD